MQTIYLTALKDIQISRLDPRHSNLGLYPVKAKNLIAMHHNSQQVKLGSKDDALADGCVAMSLGQRAPSSRHQAGR
jgi:hypothetical protein